MKGRIVAFTLVLTIVALFGVGRNWVAMYIWNDFNLPYFALLAPPQTPKDNFELGIYYFSAEHHYLGRAEFFLKRALDERDDYPAANLQLARVYFLRGEFPQALAYANRELQYHPENHTTYYLRGLINGYSKDFSHAEEDFKTFLSYEPESWAAHNDLAFVYFQEGKYTEVAAIAKDGLLFSAGNPWLHNSLGVAELNLGDTTDALQNLTLAKKEFLHMTPSQWGQAYPGNDPGLYAGGLRSILASIDTNIELVSSTTMHRTP